MQSYSAQHRNEDQVTSKTRKDTHWYAERWGQCLWNCNFKNMLGPLDCSKAYAIYVFLKFIPKIMALPVMVCFSSCVFQYTTKVIQKLNKPEIID